MLEQDINAFFASLVLVVILLLPIIPLFKLVGDEIKELDEERKKRESI